MCSYLFVGCLGLSDGDLLQNLDKYLETSLSHRVYKRGKQIKFPGQYHIINNCLSYGVIGYVIVVCIMI